MKLESWGVEKIVQRWRLRTEHDAISLKNLSERKSRGGPWGCVSKHSQGTSGQQGALDSGCLMLLGM